MEVVVQGESFIIGFVECCLPLANVPCWVHGVVTFLAMYRPSCPFFFMINTPSRVYSRKEKSFLATLKLCDVQLTNP
jgi:hypothetical protein